MLWCRLWDVCCFTCSISNMAFLSLGGSAVCLSVCLSVHSVPAYNSIDFRVRTILVLGIGRYSQIFGDNFSVVTPNTIPIRQQSSLSTS